MSGSRAISCPPRLPADRRAHGFSFVEILFAIAVLGIGFIMLAAIFPVGLQQTKLTLDETTAAGNARAAVAVISELADKPAQYPSTPPGTMIDTTILPATYAGTWPIVGTGIGQVPPGQSRTFTGQVRSLRDARNFSDAWHPVITDTNPARQPQYPTAKEMTAADIMNRRAAIWNCISGELLSKSNERNADRDSLPA